MTHAAIRTIFCPDGETMHAGFAVVLAPGAVLAAAVAECLRLHHDRVLYVSGNYPPVLTGLDRRERTFHVRRALTAYQLLSILDEAWAEETILIEHDRGLFDDAPETAAAIGRACNDRASAASVILIARRPDDHLRRMLPWATTIVHIPGPETAGRGPPPSSRPAHAPGPHAAGRRGRGHASMDL